MLETLREDFAGLPKLLARGAPEQPPVLQELDVVVAEEELAPEPGEESQREPDQLGLF
jgi:hypothetical protein